MPGGFRGCGAQARLRLSLNPPLALWSLVSHFTVNLLALRQRDLACHFAKRADDKFAGMTCGDGRGGAPLIADAAACFQRRNAYRYNGGDHVIFPGAIETYGYTGAQALVFSRGEFVAFSAGGVG